jgi:uncharacterized protein (TIGR03435 family)
MRKEPRSIRPDSRRTSDFVLRTCFCFYLCALLVAQAPAAFDVAAIKPNNSGAIGEQVRFYPPSGRVTMTNVTVKRMIQNAYALQDQQIAGGPDWIASEHFDIVANSEATNLSPMDRWVMVRALLADRFKLKMHTEAREQSVFALVLGRRDGQLGEHLKKSYTDCKLPKAPSAPIDLSVPNQCGVLMGGPGRMNFRGVTMETIAAQLSARVGRSVVDRSGLEGRYDLDLEFAPPSPPGSNADPAAVDRPADAAASIYTALQEQLGLKLESRKDSIDVTVIDSVERPVEG